MQEQTIKEYDGVAPFPDAGLTTSTIGGPLQVAVAGAITCIPIAGLIAAIWLGEIELQLQLPACTPSGARRHGRDLSLVEICRSKPLAILSQKEQATRAAQVPQCRHQSRLKRFLRACLAMCCGSPAWREEQV